MKSVVLRLAYLFVWIAVLTAVTVQTLRADEPAPGTTAALQEQLARQEPGVFRPTRINQPTEHRERTVGQHVALQAELDRLAGPICPRDGRRAVEHLGLKNNGGETWFALTHTGWTAGKDWLTSHVAELRTRPIEEN